MTGLVSTFRVGTFAPGVISSIKSNTSGVFKLSKSKISSGSDTNQSNMRVKIFLLSRVSCSTTAVWRESVCEDAERDERLGFCESAKEESDGVRLGAEEGKLGESKRSGVMTGGFDADGAQGTGLKMSRD